MIRDYLEIWVGIAVAVGVAAAGIQAATAESQSAFERLRELDESSRLHEMASQRLDRMIRRWDRTFDGQLAEGRLAERAAGRLEQRVADRLIAWQRLHRRIRRRAHLWPPGRARDLSRLLTASEIEALRAHREMFKAIGQLRTDAAAPTVLLRERARLAVDLARQRAVGEVLEAERRTVVERVRTSRDRSRRVLARTREHLDAKMRQLMDHETGADFYRRKGTLLPPVSDAPAAGFGVRPAPRTVGPGRRPGITYAVEPGTEVRAVAGGLVVLANRVEGYGRLVVVDHGDDYRSVYAHLGEITVEVGAKLERGGKVGGSGASDSLGGPKLYFEFRHDGEPVDPEPWFVRKSE